MFPQFSWFVVASCIPYLFVKPEDSACKVTAVVPRKRNVAGNTENAGNPCRKMCVAMITAPNATPEIGPTAYAGTLVPEIGCCLAGLAKMGKSLVSANVQDAVASFDIGAEESLGLVAQADSQLNEGLWGWASKCLTQPGV